MSMGRITVTLPQEQIDAAKRAVAEGRASSVSAFVSSALDAVLPEETWEEFVADLVRRFGEPSPDAEAWAGAVWASTEQSS